MKKFKKVVKILMPILAIGVGVSSYCVYNKRKQKKQLEAIKRGCIKEVNSVLDDQGDAPHIVKDDTLVLKEESNCIAKRALYDLLKDGNTYDVDVLNRFVNNNCKTCKRRLL